MQTKLSTWTPLNHPLSNANVPATLKNYSSIFDLQYIDLAMVTLIVIILLYNFISKVNSVNICLQVFEERRNLLGKWVRHALTVKNAMFTLSCF